MTPLGVEEMRRVVEEIARAMMGDISEPIPPFDSRYKGVLESCLQTPFQAFGEQEAYPGVHRRAAALFYFLIKNHPFENGNKRIAVVTLLYYLAKQELALRISPLRLYEAAIIVAESESSHMEAILDVTERALIEHCVPLTTWLTEAERRHS